MKEEGERRKEVDGKTEDGREERKARTKLWRKVMKEKRLMTG